MSQPTDTNEHQEETTEQQEQNESISNRIHAFAQSRIRKMVVSEADSNRVFALITRNGHNEIIELNTKRAELWLRFEFHRQTRLNPTENSFSRALSLLYMEGYTDSPSETIYNRIAMVNQTLYYDLGRPDWRLLKISSIDVEIVDMDENTPLFERKQTQKPQIPFEIREDPNSLDDLASLLRIPEDLRHLFKIHLITMMLPHIPVPVMVFSAMQGSTKTTTSRAIKEIIDPSSGGNVVAFPHTNDDLILTLSHRYLAAFDNVSSIDWIKSETLCTAITGIGQPRRKLFHDEDEVILSYMRKVIINGIGVTIERPDLLDRCIYYTLNTPNRNERLTVVEFNDRFSLLLPRVLGQISRVLQRALQIHQQVSSEVKKSRMADFAVYGEAISRVLGYPNFSFVNSYDGITNRTVIEISENHPLVRAIERIMEDTEHYEETIQNFYNGIRQIASQDELSTNQTFFPSAPNRVRGSIERISAHLITMGYEVVISQYTKDDGRHPRNRFVIYINRIQSSISTISTEALAS